MRYIAAILFVFGAVTIDSTGIYFIISLSACLVGLIGLAWRASDES